MIGFLDGKQMTISGWGQTTLGGSFQDRMSSGFVFGMSNAYCETKYGPNKITDSMNILKSE